jgi:hypothetical protein
MLNIHSHLSKNEVIGFLGGSCYEVMGSSKKSKSIICFNSCDSVLIIQSVAICDSMVKNQKER